MAKPTKKIITRNVTYDELDEIMDKFRQKNVVAGSFMASKKEIDNIIIPNFQKYTDFVYWLLETSTPETEEDKSNKRYLMKIFNERVKIEEDIEELIVKFNAAEYKKYLATMEEFKQ